MGPRIVEANEKPGVCYAVSGEGIELTVIDVTHPSFALHPSERELAALRARYLRQARVARPPAGLRARPIFNATGARPELRQRRSDHTTNIVF